MNSTTPALPPLSLADFQAMTFTAAAEAAALWLQQVPGGCTHVAAGAGLVLEVTLRPMPCMRLLVIDSDGTRYQVAGRELVAEVSADENRKKH